MPWCLSIEVPGGHTVRVTRMAHCRGLAALVVVLACPLAAWGGQAAETLTHTKPSADRLLAFQRPGLVAEVPVKEGDAVKAGDLPARLDDEAESLAVRALKEQAEDDTHMRAASAQLEQGKADLKRIEWASGEGAATQFEVEHARLEVTIAELSLELAQFKRKQDRLKYEEVKARLEQMRMVSPVAGKVERIVKNAGESVTLQDVVMRVVCIDPLWVDAPVLIGEAKRLKPGDRAEVMFAGGAADVAEGSVVFIAAVGDAASGTLTVRVAVPNPGGRPAGERVRVRFPTAAAAASARGDSKDSSENKRP